MINHEDNPEYLNSFLDYTMTILNKSPNTVKEYNYDLATFLKFIKIRFNLTKEEDFSKIVIKDIDLNTIKKITLDEMNNELKKLVGQLNAKKIAYLEYSGVTLYICKDCLEKIYSEINTTYNINSNTNTISNKNINKVENKKEDNSKLKINLKKDKQNASKSK